MKDDTVINIRPIRPEDEPLIVKFHKTLSEQSVFLRYFHAMKLDQRITHERLTRVCFIDYDREMLLVADRKDPKTGEHEILGVGRLSKLHGINDAEFSILISDKYQRQGLGTEFLSRLIHVGQDEKLSSIIADILPENRGMKRVCEKLGFRLTYSIEEGVTKAEIRL